MPRSKESRRAAALKGVKTRADRRAAEAGLAGDRCTSPPGPLHRRREQAPCSRKRRYTLNDDEEDEGDKRRGEDDARDAGERKRQQQQRYEEERTRASERQRMEDKLQARVEERKRRAAGEIEGNALDAEVQWSNRIDELYAREAAVPQAGT